MNVFAEHGKIKSFLKDNPITGVTVVDDIESAHFQITGHFDQSKLQPYLKGVLIPYTGHNGIDLDCLRANNLMLFITPTRSRYVAEKAVTMTLALLGNTVYYHKQLSKGNWSSRNSDERIPWISIQDAKVGLFGYGRIGTYVHQFLKGFGSTFYTIDRHKQYPADINLVDNLDTLVDTCDVIIISTPLNPTTEGIFTKELLSKMTDKFLINVGRGKVVQEQALFEALKSNTLKGYASDVWYNYPKNKDIQLPSSFPIQDFDNVILSNHSGGFTTNTNTEVNRDLLDILTKLRDEDYKDQLDLKTLI